MMIHWCFLVISLISDDKIKVRNTWDSLEQTVNTLQVYLFIFYLYQGLRIRKHLNTDYDYDYYDLDWTPKNDSYKNVMYLQ